MAGIAAPTRRLLQPHRELMVTTCAAMSSPLAGNVGHVEVKALDWSRPEQRELDGGPWDFILAAGNTLECSCCHADDASGGTSAQLDVDVRGEHSIRTCADCIYHEHIIIGLLKTCLALCSPKTTGT